MKRISSLVFSFLLISAISPSKASAMQNGRNHGGSRFLTLAGFVVAGSGVWYLIKNGINDKQNRIASDLHALECESVNFGAAPHSSSTSVVENKAPHRFGQSNHKIISTTIQDPATEMQRNKLNTRNILTRLQENLTAEEYDRLAKVKSAFDQTVEQKLDVTRQVATLGNLKALIKDLKKKYPHDASDVAILGIILGTAGIIFGMGGGR